MTFIRILGSLDPIHQISSSISINSESIICCLTSKVFFRVASAEAFLGSSILTWNIFLSSGGKKSFGINAKLMNPSSGKANAIDIALRGALYAQNKNFLYFCSKNSFLYPSLDISIFLKNGIFSI